MGYATKRVKVRRSNYHRLLRAQVGLAGWVFHSFPTRNIHTNEPGIHTEARRHDVTPPLHRFWSTNQNLVTVVKQCAKALEEE